MRIKIPSEREREVPPAGSHDAACYAVVDLGTQNTPYGAKRQLYAAWELFQAMNSRGKPFVVGKFYNLTGDARGNLRQDLEGWFGRVINQTELEGLDLLEELIGRTATIGLAHKTTPKGQTRAVVTSIMLPRNGAARRMRTTNAPVVFGLEDGLDRKAYDDLPEWLRGKIALSPEYQKAVAPETARGSTDELPVIYLGAATVSGDVRADLDDEIPF
jgi:hypothetical protein